MLEITLSLNRTSQQLTHLYVSDNEPLSDYCYLSITSQALNFINQSRSSRLARLTRRLFGLLIEPVGWWHFIVLLLLNLQEQMAFILFCFIMDLLSSPNMFWKHYLLAAVLLLNLFPDPGVILLWIWSLIGGCFQSCRLSLRLCCIQSLNSVQNDDNKFLSKKFCYTYVHDKISVKCTNWNWKCEMKPRAPVGIEPTTSLAHNRFAASFLESIVIWSKKY